MFKELLLQFLKEKDQILFEKTNIHLYEEEDFSDVETWSEEECDYFFKNLINVNFASNFDLCPWCILRANYSLSKWGVCLYGKRHGSCTKSCLLGTFNISNSYSKINDLGIISLDPKIKQLVRKFEVEYRSIKSRF
jgi:hypothetical protein